MGCCDDNLSKHTCGEKTMATCTYYKGYLPEYSELDKRCSTIHETTEELYKNQENILKSIDTSDMDDCLDYDTVDIEGDTKILVKDILKKHGEEICELKNNASPNISHSLNIDLKCLKDNQCYNENSYNNVIQLLIDKICYLENEINNLKNG